ncbi:MAG: hypothetical protein KJ018_10170, partial [Burkholderiales bacterium]|nr:hypothetical protein [Burkholderiales bacterium]
FSLAAVLPPVGGSLKNASIVSEPSAQGRRNRMRGAKRSDADVATVRDGRDAALAPARRTSDPGH